MAKTSKTQQAPLKPTPRRLASALSKASRRAQKLADAFGVAVPEERSVKSNVGRQ